MKIVKPQEVTSFPPIQQLSAEELAEVYRLGRSGFTAEELQKYTELDQGIPAEDVLRDLEEQQTQFDKQNQE